MLYAHTCVKHTKIIFSNIPKGIWDLNVDKRLEHNCVYFVCGGGMGLLFCNLLLDPRGSWIATPDYLGAGASARKVIPWRQIESLSRLSLFSLNFFVPSHSPFIFFSISLRHVDTHFLPLLHKHTALLSKPPLSLQHPCFTLPSPPPAILPHVALPSRPFSPPLFCFSFIILCKRHSGLMKTRWHNSAISAVFSFSPLLHEMCEEPESFPACFICVILRNTAHQQQESCSLPCCDLFSAIHLEEN